MKTVVNRSAVSLHALLPVIVFGCSKHTDIPSALQNQLSKKAKLHILHAGKVLDRALAKVGGRNWWTVLLGRTRAQRIWALHREGVRTADTLRHADNYSLAARSRFGFGRCAHYPHLGGLWHSTNVRIENADRHASYLLMMMVSHRNDRPAHGVAHALMNAMTSCGIEVDWCVTLRRGTTLNALVEAADLRALHERRAAGGGATLRRSAPVKAAAELKQDVLGHEIVLTAALNQVHNSRRCNLQFVYDSLLACIIW